MNQRPRRSRKRQRLDPSALPPRKRSAQLTQPKIIAAGIPKMQRSIIRAPPRHPTLNRKYSLPLKIINGSAKRMHNPRVRQKVGSEGIQKVQNPRSRRAGDDDYVPKDLADDDSDEEFLPDDGDSATEAQFCDLCRMQKTEPLRAIPRKNGLFACSDCMRPPRRRKPAVRHSGTIVIDDDERHYHSYSRRGRRSKDSNIVPPSFLPFVLAKERARNIFMTCQFCGWRKTWKASLYRSKTMPNVKICNSCRRCENHFGRLLPRNSVDRRQIESKKRTADRGIRFLSSGRLMFEPVVIQKSIEAGPVDWEKLKASHCKFHKFDLKTQALLRPEYLEKLRTTARVFPDRPPVAPKYDPTCEYLLNGPFFEYQKMDSNEIEPVISSDPPIFRTQRLRESQPSKPQNQRSQPPPLSKNSPVSTFPMFDRAPTKMVG